MPMYEMSLQFGDSEQRHFIVLANDAADARQRLLSTLSVVIPQGVDASVVGIIGGAEWEHGIALEYPAPSVGHFETDPSA